MLRQSFSARQFNSYLQTAAEEPPQRPLFGPFWQENELAIFFADTGIGKSILAVQIAESIASGIAIPPFEMGCGPRRVLLFDFEMDERQIANRYSSPDGVHRFQFSDELIRIVISPDT
ncbi:MAG: AAA family ATPase [Acidobacteria bacterium]|nr:AAA family ATPase [Acidobacteriota bacterium]